MRQGELLRGRRKLWRRLTEGTERAWAGSLGPPPREAAQATRSMVYSRTATVRMGDPKTFDRGPRTQDKLYRAKDLNRRRQGVGRQGN